jgi:formamidopyrimidine-DNA glycosylase
MAGPSFFVAPEWLLAGGTVRPVPELPDIVVYLEALQRRVLGRELTGIRVVSPSVMRTYDPPYDAPVGSLVGSLNRVGKRIVFGFGERNDGLFVVIHLMVAGRLRWETPGKPIPKKVGLAAFDFAEGSLILTEQGTKKRAGIWVTRGWDDVAALDRGGIEPLEITLDGFATALRTENRTLKRALTDPRLFSGIGNAYSDEILWEAKLSPVKRTSQLSDGEVARLHAAVVTSLEEWTARLRDEVGDGWPTKVTAFRDDMAVHGKFGEPCPRCGSKVQRIVYSSNETNYCATCQTGGKLLADRSLSHLLKDDWPKTLEELEEG